MGYHEATVKVQTHLTLSECVICGVCMYIWRYRTRNLNRDARIRCSGLHLVAKDWIDCIEKIQDDFLCKKLSEIRISGMDPSPTLQEFADILAQGEGACVFLKSLVVQYRQEGERMFEIESRGTDCIVRVSRKSLHELFLWIDYLKRGEERWVLADEPIDHAHIGKLYTLARARGTCQAAP